jgi:hypothetical protein
MGRIKEYHFDEINNVDDFADFFEDEAEYMYQPIEDKKAAKLAQKHLSEEFTYEETETSNNDDICI